VLRLALRFPLSTTIISLMIALGSFSLAPRLGFSLFPENDSPYFLIDIERPQGASVTNTDEAIKFVDGVLAAREDIAFRFANTGASNPQTYYNVFESFATPNGGQIFGAFKEWHPRSSPAEVEEIREAFLKYPAARITFRRFENGPPVEAPISIRIWGKDIDTLTSLAAEVEKRLNAVEGSRDVTNPTSARLIDLQVNVDHEKASQLGVPAGAVDQTLRAAVGGITVAQMRDPTGDAFPVRMRLDGALPASADDLKRLYVWTGQGAPVPLSDIADTGFDSGPTIINRVDLERVVTVRGYTLPGYLAIDVTRSANDVIADIPLPPGYRITYGGAAEAANESLSGLGTAMLVALFGILGILLLEFRTFALMTVVAFVIPFGIMGGIVALYLSGYPLSFIAIIGFIALIGIEIKNSILLVDFANNLRAEGVPMREAVEKAGEIRFLPVLLTSMTAIGGLLPLVLESSPLYSPLAIVIIGGLISSTILARIVTPAMYMLLAKKDEAVAAEFAAAE
jgi:multidrug efflux pump subunit AcrB